MDTEARILKVLHSLKGTAVTPGPDESLFEAGILDSFALTDFVAGLEDEFGISVPDSDLSARKFESLRKVAAYVAAKAS